MQEERVVGYMDEKIVPLKMEMKSQAPMSLENGYYISGKLEKFILTEIFEEKVSVFLPESFVDMPEQIKAFKYPSQSRPEVIKMNLDINVNFTFNLMKNLDHLTGKEAAENFCMVLSRTNPAISFSEMQTIKTKQEIKLFCFDFTSFAIDQNLYNKMCMGVTGENLFHAAFNCPEPERCEWEKAVEDVFVNLVFQ